MSQLTEHYQHNIDAIVLAGGQSRRMHGHDKGLMPFEGLPLIEHVLTRITPQVDRIFISANRNPDDYRHFGFRVIGDQRPDFQGPLAGIEACSVYCESDYTLIVSCDTPLLPQDLAEKLKISLNEHGGDASFADDGDRQHYLCTLVRTSALASVSDYLNSHQHSVHGWLNLLQARATDFSDCAGAFRNINQPTDL